MSKNCVYSELLPDFITGNLTKKDSHAITNHIKECEQCQKDLEFWQLLSSEMNEMNQQIEPPELLRDQILIKIREPRNFLHSVRHTFLLIQTQSRFIHHEIWLTSFLIMVLGILAGLISGHSEILRILIPFISALTLAIIYTPDKDPAFELVLALPNSPRQILLARMVLTYSFNFVLAFCANLCLMDIMPDVIFGQAILDWLGPMMFLSALALVLSIYLGFEIAIFISYSIWLLQFAAEFISKNMQEIFTQQILNLLESFNLLWNEPQLLLILAAGFLAFTIVQVNHRPVKFDRDALNI